MEEQSEEKQRIIILYPLAIMGHNRAGDVEIGIDLAINGVSGGAGDAHAQAVNNFQHRYPEYDVAVVRYLIVEDGVIIGGTDGKRYRIKLEMEGYFEEEDTAKDGEMTLSLNERRLAWMMARLQQERKEVTSKNLRRLVYKAIDAYVGL